MTQVTARARNFAAAALLLGLVLVAALFHRQISRSWAVYLLLNSRSPREEYFDTLAKGSRNPVAFLSRCWATGRIPHRELVMEFLRNRAASNPPWLQRAEPLMIAGSADADESVRELALSSLEAVRSPRLFDCARAQLQDADPILRLLGLSYLQKADPRRAVPVVMRLLDDSDLRIVAGAEVALMHWSGEDYGVRMREAVGRPDGAHPGSVAPADREAIRRGVKRRKEWWKTHEKEYVSSGAALTAPALDQPARRPAPDFTLYNLQGKSVRLSAYRGRPVLLNFWATWCTACVAEIPDLVALQRKVENTTAILGIALDSAADEAAEGQSRPETIRARVARAVKARSINYPVLLDPRNSVGIEYDGDELPTTVILDAQGRVRRRFIGGRSPAVLEAMLAQAARPVGAT